MTLPTVAGNWDRMSGYREKFNEDLALWVQGFPPVLKYYIIRNRRELIDVLADAMPPFVAYSLFREHGIAARRAVDLFAGIGGWSLGLALYLYPNPLYVEAVEIDARKASLLRVLFKFVKDFYDDFEYNIIVKDVRNYEIPKGIDIITASPPCEDLTPLNAFQDFKEYKGTVELTEVFVEKTKNLRVPIFYENVYSKKLADLLTTAGFIVTKEDFSKYIPQRRIRLIATKNVPRQSSILEFLSINWGVYRDEDWPAREVRTR